MKIAINAIRVSRQGGGGIDHYVCHLVNELSKLGVDFDLYTLVPEHFKDVNPSKIINPLSMIVQSNRNSNPEIKNQNPAGVRNGSPLKRWLKIVLGDLIKTLWTQFLLPVHLTHKNYDILFSPSQLDAVLLCPQKTNQVIAVLDLIPFILKNQKQRYLFFLKNIFPTALKKSAHIITISLNTKKDLMNLFNIPDNKITPILLAKPNNSSLLENPSVEKVKEIKEKQNLGRYLLCLSGNDPHKNLKNLITAYGLIANKTDFCLVIAGFQNPREQGQYDAMVKDKNLSGKVRFLGRVSGEEIPALYLGAEIFVFPSLYEGFGLPPLEALSYGIPVAVSNSSSLPEVVGEAGVYFDPTNPGDIADKILMLLNSEELKEKLRKAGPVQAKKFSWKETAKQTLEVFERVGKKQN